MKKLAVILFTILISQIGFSQDYQAEFKKYFQEKDTVNQLKILTEWEAKDPKNAELFTSYYNYHFNKSKEDFVTLSTKKPNGDGFVLKDSTNQNAGYLSNQIKFNPAEVKKAFDRIDEGIKLFPNRLDMRFGKIFALGDMEDWDNFTSEIIKTIKYSTVNNNAWTWTNNEKRTGGPEKFLSDIQTYQEQLYTTENNDLLKNMREIANEVLKYYPFHVESLTNLSLTYLINGDYEKGIEPLLKAEKINPKDVIVINNIAQAYKLKGNKGKSIEYYEKMIELGNEKDKEYAKKQIESLKK